jgi:hypothetical protein
LLENLIGVAFPLPRRLQELLGISFASCCQWDCSCLQSFGKIKPPSRLAKRFEALWNAHGGHALEKEFRFHPTRKWRADFAHLESKTLIEIEGGIYINGRTTDLRDSPPTWKNTSKPRWPDGGLFASDPTN